MEHLTDHQLLLDLDGELGSERAHLNDCADCRRRRAVLHGALDELGAAQHRRGMRRLLYAASVVVVLGVGALGWRGPQEDARPNRTLTPGATIPVSREALCAAGEPDRTVPVRVAYAVFDQYGIRDPKPRAYELDYLITPALGGADDVRNLWPQPYAGGMWNARVKDALEDFLRDKVCTGEMELEEAQREIATDWIAAYKRYFGTNAPLVAHLSFQKDRAWGE